MIIGVTGSRIGPTDLQRISITVAVSQLCTFDAELHHGCCIGVDERMDIQANEIVNTIIGHPPIDNALTSDRAMGLCDVTLPKKPYLERNHDIVDSCNLLIAVPFTKVEILRSGTWATIRYAL